MTPHPAQHSWLRYSAGGWQSQRGHMLGILRGEALSRTRWKSSPSGPTSWLSCPLRGQIHTPRHSLPARRLLEGQVHRVGGASTAPLLPGDRGETHKLPGNRFFTCKKEAPGLQLPRWLWSSQHVGGKNLDLSRAWQTKGALSPSIIPLYGKWDQLATDGCTNPPYWLGPS